MAGKGCITYSTQDYPKTQEPEENAVLKQGLSRFNARILEKHGTCFSIFAMDHAETIGGLIGERCGDTVYLKTLWVHDDCRRQGVGAKLMDMLESKAKSSGVSRIITNTYGFQSRVFYENQGFELFSVVPAYILGHDKLYLKKTFNV